MILSIQACATGYKSDGFVGGYSETQLDENVFKVAFRGNGYTRQDRAADFTLLRSAELALKSGYSYFVVIDSESYTTTSTRTTPTITNTTASAYSAGNQAYGSATSTATGGQTYNISKPSESNTIICFKEKPKSGFSYNANFIFKSLTEKYGIGKQD
jgi:hypothetical protein